MLVHELEVHAQQLGQVLLGAGALFWMRRVAERAKAAKSEPAKNKS
jgi:hypothetical protein